MVSETTVDVTGTKTVSMKTTGNEKYCVTVGLAAKGDGTKLKTIHSFQGWKAGCRKTKKVVQQ